MPSRSLAQKRIMAAAAHDPVIAKQLGIDQETAKEWNKADKDHPNNKLPEHVGKNKSTNESLVKRWSR